MPSEHEPIEPDEVAALFRRCGINSSMRCALAVSGGGDSTALMHLFADWLRREGGDAGLHTVLTVDHGLRSHSAEEALAVASQAVALGFRHTTLVWHGDKPQTGVQAAARMARYRLLKDYVRSNAVELLLTGHTRDDQAETFLMRLARGSGLDGLSAIAPRLRFSDLGVGDAALDEPEIARPLIEVGRARLRAMLQGRTISWIEDPSNYSSEFERPRLRAARANLEELGLTDTMLALSASRLLRARRALNGVVDQFCSPSAGVISVDQCGLFTIDRVRLRTADAEIALRAMGRVVAAAGGSQEPVPLGKLETLTEALQNTGTRTAKWTLARAMIAAKGGTVTVGREPGRNALPRMELKPGNRMCWDGRFWVEGEARLEGAIEVRALGQTARRQLRRDGVLAANASASAIEMVPSFWREGNLTAVPSLDFWSAPVWRTVLHAQFVWPARPRGLIGPGGRRT